MIHPRGRKAISNKDTVVYDIISMVHHSIVCTHALCRATLSLAMCAGTATVTASYSCQTILISAAMASQARATCNFRIYSDTYPTDLMCFSDLSSILGGLAAVENVLLGTVVPAFGVNEGIYTL